MKVFCVFSLEFPHRGDSNEYTQYTIFNTKRKSNLNYLKSAAMGFFPRNSTRVRNSRGKRGISIQAAEVLLYVVLAEDESELVRFIATVYIKYFVIFILSYIFKPL